MTTLKLGTKTRTIPLREEDREPILAGVCKDCGNGTLNNDLNPAFEEWQGNTLACIDCHSTHLDIL